MEEEKPLPESLIAKLRASEPDTAMITARVDREISAQAAEQFKDRVRRRRSLPVWLATAASVLLAVFLVTSPMRNMPAPTDDFDQSGSVDIADVLAMARRGEASQRDIDALAMRIVSLADDGAAQ